LTPHSLNINHSSTNYKFWIAGGLLALGLLLTSNNSHADEIDDFVIEQMKARKIPGLQLAIVKDQKIVKTAHYGLSNLQDSVAVDKDTVFTINSMTKAFTGVAIMQLVEQGKLELNTGIAKYLTDLPLEWRELTVNQLMSHTSGLPAIMGKFAGLISSEGIDASWEIVKKKPMEFEAGTKFKYNQVNYILLGKIIDHLSGMPFVDFITQNQLNKVGMTKTADAGFAHFEKIVPHQARAYTYYKTGKLTTISAEFAPVLRTTAGMTSNAEEIAKWSIALQSGKLLKKKASLKTLWQPMLLKNGKTAGFNNHINGYALGFPIINRTEHPAVTSIGADRSALVIYPQDNLSVVILSNLTGALPSTFIDEIAGFYYPDMKAENGFGLTPDIKLLWQALESNGYDKALQSVTQLQKEKGIKFNESELNTWGYKLAGRNKLSKALEVFKLNTQLFPKSANTYDSLAEVYWLLGELDRSVFFYNKVLELQPDNGYVKGQLKKLKAEKN